MNGGTHVGEDTSGNDNGQGPWSLFRIVVMPASFVPVPSTTFRGQTVGFYNPHVRKFASMLGAPYDMSVSQVMAPTLPASHTWERFEITDGYNGRIALYSRVHQRFARAHSRGTQWDASGVRADARLGGPHWHQEQFEILRRDAEGGPLQCTGWPAGSTGSDEQRCLHGNTLNDGFVYVYNHLRGTANAYCGQSAGCSCCRRDQQTQIYNIYSPHRDRFMRVNGNHVGTSNTESGESNEAKFRIISFNCNLRGTRPRGYWNRVGSGTTNNWNYQFSEGRETTDSQTRDSSWSSSVERSVSSSLEVHIGGGGVGSDAIGGGVTSSSTQSLTSSETRSQSTSISRAVSRTVSATTSHTATAPGAFWQYTVRVQDSCGVSNLRTQDVAFVRAEAGSGPPCCLPNNFADSSFTHGPCLPGSTCFGCAPEVCNGTAPNTSPRTYNNCPGFCTHGLTASNLFQRCQGGAQASSCQSCTFCRQGRLPATGI